MSAKVAKVAEELAREIGISKENVFREGIRTFLEKNLREIKIEIYEITSKYNVASVEEMERRYREGSLEESESWKDFQRLDHLEYKREHLSRILEEIQ